MDFVADTHSLLWQLYLPQRLGRAARESFAAAELGQGCIYLPAVVIAESLMVVEKGRLPGVNMERFLPLLDAMRQCRNYALLTLTPDTVIASQQFTPIPDIFDRLVVTEAIRLGCPLISKDQVIARSGLLPVVWD